MVCLLLLTNSPQTQGFLLLVAAVTAIDAFCFAVSTGASVFLVPFFGVLA